MKAKLKFARIAPRKLRLVADLIRGRDVNAALSILEMTQKKKGADMLKKLLKSAISNAESKTPVDTDQLYVQQICVDPGTIIKRFMPRSMGRASTIFKRTSHIDIRLAIR